MSVLSAHVAPKMFTHVRGPEAHLDPWNRGITDAALGMFYPSGQVIIDRVHKRNLKVSRLSTPESMVQQER